MALAASSLAIRTAFVGGGAAFEVAGEVAADQGHLGGVA
jgi:hypothetical protein